MGILELSSDDVVTIIDSMKEEYKNSDRGIEIIRVEDGYQLTTKKRCMSIYIQFLIREASQI